MFHGWHIGYLIFRPRSLDSAGTPLSCCVLPLDRFSSMFSMRSIINATVLHLQLLQILLQPALAPQLHACFDHCHAFQKSHATAHGCCGKEDCGRSKKSPNSDSHSHHNCTSCPICDVLTAPRVPAVICSLQLVTLLTRLDPAATLPVFALPAILQPQPRGPPCACPATGSACER